MELLSISQVSKAFDMTTRTLRYYEQIGLIHSIKKEGYAYRTYDQEAILKLQQISILKKLKVPLKQIKVILEAEGTGTILDILQQTLDAVSIEAAALTTIRNALQTLVNHIRRMAGACAPHALLKDENLVAFIASITNTQHKIQEELTMSDINEANENLSQLRDVRILYLPPATVAAYQFEGDDPEDAVGNIIDDFVRKTNLFEIKPDFRHYGFNNPNPVDETNYHGYEMWVTIPEDMEVPAPLVKKQFPGGQYAAHMIKIGDFHEWDWIIGWVNKSDKYEAVWGDPVCMYGLLEEHLNYGTHIRNPSFLSEGLQLDLLVPIREKE